MKKNNKINILHLLSGFGVGGAEKLVVDLSSYYADKGNASCKVLTLKDNVSEKYQKDLKKTGIELVVFKKEDYKNPLTLLKLLKFINDNKIHVIHSHEAGAKRWSVLCKLAKPSLKLFNTVHDSNVIVNYSRIRCFLHNFFIYGTMAISSHIYNQCKSNGIKKVHLIYNGVKTELFSKSKPVIEKDSSFLKIVNVSRLSLEKKGHDILLNALGECKKRGINFSCDFIGGDHPRYPNAFEVLDELCEKNNIKNEVSFLGNRNNVSELLQNYNLFILPSRYEGMPIALLEAMSAGLPVIASDINVSREIINHGENGFMFESENYMDLADKICELYHNREKLISTAEEGYKTALGYDISVMADKYYELYKHSLSK